MNEIKDCFRWKKRIRLYQLNFKAFKMKDNETKIYIEQCINNRHFRTTTIRYEALSAEASPQCSSSGS